MKGSRATLKRERKVAKELEMEGSKSYNTGALCQRNRDLGLIPQASVQSGLGTSAKSSPGEGENTHYPLSQVPSGSISSPIDQVSFREQRIVALQEITRPLELVTEQKKIMRIDFHFIVIFINFSKFSSKLSLA